MSETEQEREREREQIKTPFMLCARMYFICPVSLSVFFEVC
jgi:hypothetical protein